MSQSSETPQSAKNSPIQKMQIEFDKVCKALKHDGRKKEQTPLEDKEVRSLFEGLVSILSGLLTDSADKSDIKERVVSLEASNRSLQDNQDHHHQRSLRGKFIISPGKDAPLKTDTELLKDEVSITDYVIDLIEQKYSFKPHHNEIKVCHNTNSGLIVFRFGNLAPGSSFSKLSYAIKAGKSKDVRYFFNFALTPRRASLLFELRQLKRSGKIYRFYSDYDGTISVVPQDGDKKRKLTSFFMPTLKTLKTSTVQELLDSIL